MESLQQHTKLDPLLSEIATRRDDLILLTQNLIRIPTLNPPGENYRDICEFLNKRLTKHGFNTEMVRAYDTPGDSDKYPRWNLVARREGTGSGECVHFNSHIDVVEVGSGWTQDPFGGALVDGKIYGRGACDMKGGLAASIIAVESFIHTNPDFQGAIEISATGDEESGGYGGVAYLAEKGFFDPKRVQHVIIPEPLNKDRVCLGHRGGWWAEIETFGEIAHGSMPFLGDCAVRHMGAVIDKFETQLYPAMAARRTDMPVVPDGARSSTMNINSIHGGQAEQADDFTGLPAHCVPDSCRIVIDRRFLVEETLDDDKFVKEFTNSTVLPSMTDREAPIAASVAKQIEIVMGKPAEFVASPGTYDQKHIDRIGTLKNCVAYGPGILELAHKPDEYVGVEDMMDSVQVMARCLADILLEK